MFPLRDLNPTHHRAVLTIALILVNVMVFVFVQERSTDRVGVVIPSGQEVGIAAVDKFSFERAAIPCELTQRRALDFAEVRDVLRGVSDTCDDTDRPQLFPDKAVLLAVLASMFFHADWFHLLFNMWFLWLFGNNIEDHMGPTRYAGFYLLAGVAATAAHVALQPDSAIPVIGASGAVAGIMGAYLVWFPRAPIQTLAIFLLVRVKAIWWLLLWFALQFFTGAESQVAWAAHVGGFAFGAVVGVLVRQIRPLCRWMWREPWKRDAYYRWDLTGGSARYETGGAGRRTRFGRRSW